MWPQTFGERLESWQSLRHRCNDLDSEMALASINFWWFQTPWRAYHLHWDDRNFWPDPWQLLDDNLYCGLARGLGIMYTIALLERSDLQDAVLIESQGDNLVLVNQKKYILNWDADQIVNINIGNQTPKHSVSLEQIKQQIK